MSMEPNSMQCSIPEALRFLASAARTAEAHWMKAAADEIERLQKADYEFQAKVADGITDAFLERRWIPVSERLPPVDEKVLYTCFMEGDGPEDYFTDVNAGFWDGEARNLPGNPAMKYDDSNDWQPCSHWQPLPEPPEVK